jgi:asparagine synthase (glutamine-hydrolysing)
MCGIFGIIDYNRAIDHYKLQEVSKVIKHRGPDDEGYLLASSSTKSYQSYKGDGSPKSLVLPHIKSAKGNDDTALLHRRLSIIDLSDSGHQPMNYADRYWITLNGEIYNYLEIKEELRSKGYSFKSTSDTEILLAAYIEWGEDCIQRFNGMWAFAIWDSKENSFFLSRDRFGVKPLYYFYSNSIFIFCSEIKGIRHYLNDTLSLDLKQVLRFLDRGEYMEGESDSSLFKGIRQLMPGHNLILRNKKLKSYKYYDLKIVPNKNKLSDNIDILRKLFSESIKYRLRSDVEVGACLSGGIDSSSIVSYATSLYNKTFNTFSATWPGESIDESFYIDKVNQKWNCVAHAFKPDLTNLLETIDMEIWHQEMPLSGSSLLAQWFVMEQAKKADIKVLLDGQGADEMLAGYPHYINTYINDLFVHFNWKELFIHKDELTPKGYVPWYPCKAQLYNFLVLKKYEPFFPIEPSFFELYKGTKNYIAPSQFNSLAELQKYEIEKNTLLPLLHIEDRNSMAHSVESRLPFLDYKMVEFCINIPTQQKIQGTKTKYLLRESMKDFLPSEVYKRRDKIGFATPLESRYFGPGKEFNEYAIDYILNSGFWRMGLINHDFLNINTPVNNIFALYSLARFINNWF